MALTVCVQFAILFTFMDIWFQTVYELCVNDLVCKCVPAFTCLTHLNCNSVTLVCNAIMSDRCNQCRYFTVASEECYAPKLQTVVTCVDGQASCNFHGMVQCYGQMLHIVVTLHRNFLHLVTIS